MSHIRVPQRLKERIAARRRNPEDADWRVIQEALDKADEYERAMSNDMDDGR